MNVINSENEVPLDDGQVPISQIKRAVATHFGLKVADLVSGQRDKKNVLARHLAMYLARTMTGKSYPCIACFFGGRDHTTIIHGVNKIARRKDIDVEIATALAALEKTIHACKTTSGSPPVEDLTECARAAKNVAVIKAKSIAGQGVRGPAIEMRDRLNDLYGEVVQGHGIIEPGRKIELLISAAGTWTLLEIDQKTGNAGVISNGDTWIRSSQSIPARKG